MKFWKNKRVFITGHTGFKGSWLCLWLNSLGAEITGYALDPPTNPSLFELADVKNLVNSIHGDVRDFDHLKKAMRESKPEIAFHLAAQPLVRDSYKLPLETFSTNVMGTAHFLEAVKLCKSVKAAVNVTTDKVYKNDSRFTIHNSQFLEDDPLGGYDPYSSSKACSELVASAYRQSYAMNIATARAGNVIGGGDWATDRLVPDFVRATLSGQKIFIRNPKAVRPWQHVLEPLSGYLLLAEKLYKHGEKFQGAWNFGPDHRDAKPVEYLVSRLCEKWGKGAGFKIDQRKHPHETAYLMLDSGKAREKLGWKPRWNVDLALDKIIEWTRAYVGKEDLREVCLKQIEEYHG